MPLVSMSRSTDSAHRYMEPTASLPNAPDVPSAQYKSCRGNPPGAAASTESPGIGGKEARRASAYEASTLPTPDTARSTGCFFDRYRFSPA